jgi:hypothetical protein
MTDFAGGTLANEFLLDFVSNPDTDAPEAMDEEAPAMEGFETTLDLSHATTLLSQDRIKDVLEHIARLREAGDVAGTAGTKVFMVERWMVIAHSHPSIAGRVHTDCQGK